MSTPPDAGRLLALVSTDIGWDIAGSLKALEAIPGQIHAIRERIAPLKAELKMLEAKYASKGRSPSHYDIQRSVLMSKLKEEARRMYEANPNYRTGPKGQQIKIELTDGRSEDMAHAAQEYKDFVRRASHDQKRIGQIGKELGPMYDEIERLRGAKEYLMERINMAVALTNAWGRESRL